MYLATVVELSLRIILVIAYRSLWVALSRVICECAKGVFSVIPVGAEPSRYRYNPGIFNNLWLLGGIKFRAKKKEWEPETCRIYTILPGSI